jgi:hypothetical protein
MTTRCSIEDRMERAAARWTDAVTRVNHATVTVQASGWRVVSSRAVLDWGRRPISGGSDPPFDEVAVRQRLRLLVGSGVLPHFHSGRLWAGRARVEHACTICSMKIVVGEIELELTSPAGVVIFVHRRCFDFWVGQPVEMGSDLGQPRAS